MTTRIPQPPLRENLGLPFIWIQLMLLTYTLRKPSLHRPGKQTLKRALSILITAVAIVFWQFTQFVLLLELLALVAVYLSSYYRPTQEHRHSLAQCLVSFSSDISLSFLLAWILQMRQNTMLVSAFVLHGAISVLVTAGVLAFFRRLNICPWETTLQSSTITTMFGRIMHVFGGFATAVILRMLCSRILQIDNDAHILSILADRYEGPHQIEFVS